MHAWLAFLAGFLIALGVMLIFLAAIGIPIYGLAVQVEAALAITLLFIAGIVAWLFYVGVKAQYKKVKTGIEALIGAKGVVTSPLNPKGEVRVLGEFWQATTKDGALPNGQNVEVEGMEGMFLVVKAAEQKA